MIVRVSSPRIGLVGAVSKPPLGSMSMSASSGGVEGTVEGVVPLRSVLYCPGNKPRAMAKLASLDMDAVILDLEDGTGLHDKDMARNEVAKFLQTTSLSETSHVTVRINPFDTELGKKDLEALACSGADAIVLPKVESVDMVREVEHELHSMLVDGKQPTTSLWCMIETPRGVANAFDIATSPREYLPGCVKALLPGTADLSVELGIRSRPDRMPLMHSLQSVVLAARAANIAVIDGVYLSVRDLDGFVQQCEEGRDIGMHGKQVIHPATIEAANQAFRPQQDEVEAARRIVEAFEGSSLGVVEIDGKLVEHFHLDQAKQLMAIDKLIRDREERRR